MEIEAIRKQYPEKNDTIYYLIIFLKQVGFLREDS